MQQLTSEEISRLLLNQSDKHLCELMLKNVTQKYKNLQDIWKKYTINSKSSFKTLSKNHQDLKDEYKRTSNALKSARLNSQTKDKQLSKSQANHQRLEKKFSITQANHQRLEKEISKSQANHQRLESKIQKLENELARTMNALKSCQQNKLGLEKQLRPRRSVRPPRRLINEMN